MIDTVRTLVTLLCVATCVSASTFTWDQTEARIELKPDEKEARATFTVTNNGDKPVRIARIKTSCGCTGSIVNRKIVEPGKSAEIVGTFHKGKRQGLNHNRLEVFIENQPNAIATLHMIVQIPELINLQPKILYWNNESKKTERPVRIQLDKRYVEQISSIDYNKEHLTLSWELDPADKEKELIRILPKSFDRVIHETILIKAKGKDGADAEARLHLFVQP